MRVEEQRLKTRNSKRVFSPSISSFLRSLEVCGSLTTRDLEVPKNAANGGILISISPMNEQARSLIEPKIYIQ